MMGNLSKKKFLMTMLILGAMQESLYAVNSKEPEKVDISSGKLEKDKTEGNKYLYFDPDKDYNIKMEDDITINVTESEKGTANIEVDNQRTASSKQIEMKDGTTLTLNNTSQNIDSTTTDKIGGVIRVGENGRLTINSDDDATTSLIIRDDSMDKVNNRFSDGAIQGTNITDTFISVDKVDISSVGHGINSYNDEEKGYGYISVNADDIAIKGGFDSQGKLINQDANGIFISNVENKTDSRNVSFGEQDYGAGAGAKAHIEGANSAIVARGGTIVDITTGFKEINLIGHSEKNAAIDFYSDNSITSRVYVGADYVNIEAKNHAIKAGKNTEAQITGQININADSTGTNKDKGIQSIAISSGVKSEELNDEKNRSQVTVRSRKNESSFINGDIIAGKSGSIKIDAGNIYNGMGTFTVKGNILAANGGIYNTDLIIDKRMGVVDLGLGKGGYLEGRADNYSNGQLKGDEGELIDKIINKSEVNIDLGENSTWKMTGESWVDNLAGDGTVILANENKRGQKIHIDNMYGIKTFVLNLDNGNPEKSDMIYVGNVENEATQILKVANEDELLDNFFDGEKIKFADVLGSKSDQTFGDKYVVQEKGINDVDWDIEYVEINKDKAVDSNRHEVYLANNTGNARPTVQQPNDVALSIMEMARANYSSAVFMDNLNKRLGDMTFAEGDSGIWVRMRNDRVGEDEEYRLHNYMTQIGYDKIYNLENGKEYRGIAFDYADGQMEYKNLHGESDIDRYTATLYDTRLFDNGFYSDYTAKIGYMQSEFDIRGRETGNQVKGDYDNLYAGIGAEFGKRFNLGEKSYFEPQVQLQYTYIDDTDYTTNQNTKVNYDEIHSLIGRAGIRLGYDFYKENSKDNTVYLKLDINHEFLGDQEINAQDRTGTLNKTYHNDDTWYDVGIGGAKNLTEDLYVYADVESQFGHKDNSWQFNLGFRYKFGSLKDFTFNTSSLFDSNKIEIKTEGKELIKNASEKMNNKKVKGTLLIEGHTDWTGSEEYNQLLSEKRAKAVEKVFKENVTNENIKYETKGYGEIKPVADNKTSEGRAKNRRVEINFNK